jgi:hypothetical protein
VAGSPLPLKKITEPVSNRKCGKLSAVFLLKPLKLVFCYLKSKFPLNLKIKYQRFNAKGRPFD